MTTDAQPRPMPSIFWPAAWMTILVVATKASYVAMATYWQWAAGLPDHATWLFVEWAAAASRADAIFSLGAGLVAGALLWLTRSRPRLARVLGAAFLALGVGVVLYAVVSRQVFGYYGAPLTYQLLRLGGEPTKLWSSIAAFVSAPALIAAAAVPAAYLLLSRASRSFELRLAPRVRVAVRAGVVLAAAAWIALGGKLAHSSWFEAQDRHHKESPHAVLLASMALAAADGRFLAASDAMAATDGSDFEKPPRLPHEPGGARGGPHGRRPMNVILIVLESVGARYLGIHGSGLDTTPSLQAESRNCLVFDAYYAPVAWTAYSLLAMTMSQRPPMERYNEVSFQAASLQGVSLAEALRGAGYRTAFMSAGDPDWASAGFLEKKGFGEVVRVGELPGASRVSSWGTEDRLLFERMSSWIDETAGRPFFLMAWTDQTHHPYAVAPGQDVVEVLDPERKKAKPALANYASLVREADSQIGKLLIGLRRRGLAENTLVIVTGDHGEAFGEPHGGSGHGFTVYDEEVRVPLVACNPMLFRGGGRSATLGSHIDLAPTILGLLGQPAPEGWDGTSLFAAGRPERVYLFAAAWGQYLLGVRSGPWKYVYDARLGAEELYNLADDPDELRDLSRQEPGRALELRRRLLAWQEVERRKGEQRRSVAAAN